MATRKNIRRDLATQLPRVLQGAITWLTGQRAPNEPAQIPSEHRRLTTVFATFGAGASLGVMASLLGGPAALTVLPLAWTMTVGAARDLQLSVYHHCAHGNVISQKRSKQIGNVIATLLQIERFSAYAAKHCSDHHGRSTVSSDLDPTVQFLIKVIGIRPGDSVAANRRRFIRALASPNIHAGMLKARMVSQFGAGASWTNRLVSAAYLGLIGGGAIASGAVLPMLLGFVLPLTVGYQAAQIARLMVEHRWPEQPITDNRRTPAEHDELTVAVRCALPLPEQRTTGAMLKWIAGMAFNAWIRWTVLPGDSGPAHHWHHARAREPWFDYVNAAAKWEAERELRGLPPIMEAWGYLSALQMTLDSFSAARPASLAAPVRRSRHLVEA